MNSHLAATPIRLSALALAATLVACSSVDSLFSGDKVDYRSAAKAKALEVPPDLTQLAQQSRYQVQGGVISAANAGGAAAAPVTTAAATGGVAITAQGEIRVERAGQQRWLVAPAAPEVLWPRLKAFWEQRGFTLEEENAALGVMETGWNENRAKLPNDVVRSTLGRLFGNVYDSGERDRYRTRIERTAQGSEIYLSHRGLEEIYTDEKRENTRWRPRAPDPQLEAEMLARLMLALGGKDEPTRAAGAPVAPATPSAQAQQVLKAPEGPARARAVAGAAALEVDEPFDRAWRRVGLALDRGGFSVEDRDRNAGLYYVRYVDPKAAGKEEPGWWARLFGDSSNPQAAVRYRIAVKGQGEKTAVTVLTSAGGADSGENGRNIAAALVTELR
ncbi:outer membrane protein assembly factor BamC [Rubrivivax sp. A210]|uniref:outer membrane protein assembly factor BamC n=1 Tax=Rubrivivax sp. A210 TaxID=2772301 RepID=UPI001F32A0FB|nr:outer membrane protein assembly factor BamC [Rubrivivax sp. A210]